MTRAEDGKLLSHLEWPNSVISADENLLTHSKQKIQFFGKVMKGRKFFDIYFHTDSVLKPITPHTL